MTLYAFRRVIAPRLRLYDFDRCVGVQQLASIAKSTLTEQSVVRQTLLRFHGTDFDDGSWLEQWLLQSGAMTGQGSRRVISTVLNVCLSALRTFGVHGAFRMLSRAQFTNGS